VLAAALAAVVTAMAAGGEDAKPQAPKPPPALQSEYAQAVRLVAERATVAKPWLRRQTILARDGTVKMGGERVTAADETHLTVTVIDKQGERAERRAWGRLEGAVVRSILTQVVNRKSAEDCLAAGVIALTWKQAADAERYFEAAARLGVKIDRYVEPIATAALADVQKLLAAGKHREALDGIARIRAKYAKWSADHRGALDAALARAKSGIAEAEAQQHIAAARKLAKSRSVSDRWDLKLALDEIRGKYAGSAAVRNSAAELKAWEAAVADLGAFLAVGKEGDGRLRTVQEGVNAAGERSLVEIQDDGPYYEKLVIPEGAAELVLRGKAGCWPVIASRREDGIGILVDARKIEDRKKRERAGTLTLSRLILAHAAPSGTKQACLSVARPVALRNVAVVMYGKGLWVRGTLSIEDSFLLTAPLGGRATAVNCLWIGGVEIGGTRFDRCTMLGTVTGPTTGGVAFSDCIVHTIRSPGTYSHWEKVQLRNCNVFAKAPFDGKVRQGKMWFADRPRFRDPHRLNYMPAANSVHWKRGVGCRYTPEMLEMANRLVQLRKQSIVKF